GKPTAQGKGFFHAAGSSPHSLEAVRQGKVKGFEVRLVKEHEYLFVLLQEKGRSTREILAKELPGLIASLDFPKKMRWGSLDVSYARPIRWLVALFGKEVIPFTYGDITSNRNTFGHAQLKPARLPLAEAKLYLSTLKRGRVMADIEERKKSILKQLDAIEKQVKARVLEKERVLSEVLHMVEWPTLTHASFDKEFLQAPKEVLISEMVHHQKYFPLADKKGHLLNQFVITADTTPTDLIRKGNQKVLSARLKDGVFLYEQDLQTPLEKFNEKLALMTFQKELGSMLNKVMRLTHHVKTLNAQLAIGDEKKLLRAALLSKADLASALVGEFPELQGVAGEYYALHQKEDAEVAAAIKEQWMPRNENAPLPVTACGTLLSMADKFDNLLSYYSIGLKPTSSSDPYALRRQTLGIVRMLIDGKHTIDLQKVLEECSTQFSGIKKRDELIQEILQFITSRAKGVFEEFGFKKDEVDAVLQESCRDPFDQFCKVEALHIFRKKGPEFAKLYEVYKRAKGQLDRPALAPLNHALLREPAEKALMQKLDTLEKHWQETLAAKDYLRAFEQIATLQVPLAHLFDTVKILSEDAELRNNRIALLHKVFGYFQKLLDFSKIQEMRS
ncbi:MAG: glycine--tRNA ligase subunit beta, partial [Chlamydiales bacterium]